MTGCLLSFLFFLFGPWCLWPLAGLEGLHAPGRRGDVRRRSQAAPQRGVRYFCCFFLFSRKKTVAYDVALLQGGGVCDVLGPEDGHRQAGQHGLERPAHPPRRGQGRAPLAPPIALSLALVVALALSFALAIAPPHPLALAIPFQVTLVPEVLSSVAALPSFGSETHPVWRRPTLTERSYVHLENNNSVYWLVPVWCQQWSGYRC